MKLVATLRWISPLFFLASTFALASSKFLVGQKNYVFKDLARNRSIPTFVWYPAETGASPSPIVERGNPFIPVVAAKDAKLASTPKSFPVVLLSHGSSGRVDKLFWLTERLVQNGIVVIGANHPGNTTSDSTADGMMRIWNRPQDLSFALDSVLQQAEFKSRLDLSKVAAAGHSAGGTGALLLGGARLSHEKFQSPIPHCAGTKDPYYAKVCNELKEIDLRSYPKEVVEKDYTDKRVKAVIALDPGLVRSFKTGTFDALAARPLIFIADKINTSHDEIYSKEFKKVLPASSAITVPDSYHMSFLMACKPEFPKDDPELKELCIDNDRKLKIQKEIAEKTLAFFHKNWGR